MNFTLNDNAVNFELEDRKDFELGEDRLNFKLNAITDVPVVPGCFRLLEDGDFRILEDGDFRILEQCGGSGVFDYTFDFTFG